jgi:hypothetical protein
MFKIHCVRPRAYRIAVRVSSADLPMVGVPVQDVSMLRLERQDEVQAAMSGKVDL